jgi:glyoxylase-like metal-dependent hydrolase (beta-lactamase superfamily II)
MARGHKAGRWRRHFLIGLVSLLIPTLAVYLGFHGQPVTTNDGPEASSFTSEGPILKHSAVTLIPGIHLLGGLAPAAAYVVETTAGLILIDSGLEPDAQRLKEQMTALRLDWRRVHAILLTHAHGDHSGGADHLRSATGARVYAGTNDAAVLRAGGPREAFYSTFYVPENIQPVAMHIDVELQGDETIEFGDTRIQSLAVPGHTPGSICYFLERGPLRVLFSGDVILSLSEEEGASSPFARRLGTYAAYLAPRYRGDAQAFAGTLRALRALPVPQLVLPGHPRNSPVPQNAAITQKRWESMLDAGIQEMDQLQARYAKDGANFLDDVPKELLPNLYYFGDVQRTAVYGFFAEPEFILINAPGGVGLSRFLSTRLAQLGLRPNVPSIILLTSAQAEDLSGLAKLPKDWHCRVVAPAAFRRIIEKACQAGTEFITAEELARRSWSEILFLPLRGGPTSFAYHVKFNHKSVVFTGRFPIKPVHEVEKRQVPALMQARANAAEYQTTLDHLQELRPDLWLPSLPMDGQNANLYPGEWMDMLDQNEQLLRR